MFDAKEFLKVLVEVKLSEDVDRSTASSIAKELPNLTYDEIAHAIVVLWDRIT